MACFIITTHHCPGARLSLYTVSLCTIPSETAYITLSLRTFTSRACHNWNVCPFTFLVHNSIFLSGILFSDIYYNPISHSFTHTVILICVLQRRRRQHRVFKRNSGSFWLQQVLLMKLGRALGCMPTGGSCRKMGLMRKCRTGLCWCNSGPHRWVRQ